MSLDFFVVFVYVIYLELTYDHGFELIDIYCGTFEFHTITVILINFLTRVKILHVSLHKSHFTVLQTWNKSLLSHLYTHTDLPTHKLSIMFQVDQNTKRT